MKLFTALAALTLITAPAAHAQWGGGAPQSAAAAYCASRAAGNSHNKAGKDARWMLSGGMQGNFSSNMATVFTSGRQMMQTTGYMAKQMCPEYFGGSLGGSSFPRINRSRTKAEQSQLIESFRTVGSSISAEDNKACSDSSVGPATKEAFGC